MGYQISLVSTFERLEWISNRFNLQETIYMGDGIYDPLVFEKVGYSIAPANAFIHTKQYASFVTLSRGGEGAVAEAVIHVLELISKSPFDILKHPKPIKSGNWEMKNPTAQ
jgi:3-deoxy-D-manno-octulosonate 8-phosphate phosphatase (KDO 8-P phosphatase)